MLFRPISAIILGTIALVGCSQANSDSKKPTIKSAYVADNEYYGLGLSLKYSTADTVDFYPINLKILPKGSKKLRYEGNGWYTFLWKGGCYMATGQDTGKWNFSITINQAHNKQACDLSVDPPEEVHEYDQNDQSDINSTMY